MATEQPKIKITRDLNLAIHLNEDLIAHVRPINKECFERYYETFLQTWMYMHFNMLSGAGHKCAGRVFKKMCKQSGETYEEFFAEVHDNTMVAAKKTGFRPVTWSTAISQKLLDEEDIADIENFIPFYIAYFLQLDKKVRDEAIPEFLSVRSVQATSSSFTEYLSSYQTSVPDVSGGEQSTT